jgi:anti-anti-sigma regulatory factor
MLRITEDSGGDQVITLKLEGKLVGTWIPELERICLYNRDEKKKTIVLDFSGVTFIHKEGVRTLERIIDERVHVINCSPFIESLFHKSITSRKRFKK